MTALTKLFRTTTFRLSLTYLALFSAAAVVAIFYIYWNTTVLLTRQLNETIDAELKGLAEQYTDGGLTSSCAPWPTAARRRATASISWPTRPGAAWRAISPVSLRNFSNSLGPVEFEYRRPAEGGIETRLAFANVFRLPGATVSSSAATSRTAASSRA